LDHLGDSCGVRKQIGGEVTLDWDSDYRRCEMNKAEGKGAKLEKRFGKIKVIRWHSSQIRSWSDVMSKHLTNGTGGMMLLDENFGR
jgi:hypothetical protein